MLAAAAAGLSSTFDQSVECTFNASIEDVAATELIASQHCEIDSCLTLLAASMARNYEEVLGRPFNGTIAGFAIRCWCEGSMGVMADGAVMIDTYEEMHATCVDPECRKVKAHTLERYMDGICTKGEALGGHCPDGREVEMASLVSDCSCDYHALGWPFPWGVLELEARVDHEILARMCGMDSCDKLLARLNEIWPDSAAPGVRKCGVNSAWEASSSSPASLSPSPPASSSASGGNTSTSASDAGATLKSATTPSRDELPIGAVIGGGLGAVAMLAAAAVAIAWNKIKRAQPARTEPTVVTGIPVGENTRPATPSPLPGVAAPAV